MKEIPNQEEFKKYLREKKEENEPIDQSFAAEMEKEMERGMREEGLTFGGKTEYDPSGTNHINYEKESMSFPNGPDNNLGEMPLNVKDETEMTADQLDEEVIDLTEFKKSKAMLFLKDSTAMKNAGITEQTTLFNLEDMRTQSFEALGITEKTTLADIEKKLTESAKLIRDILGIAVICDFDYDTLVYDLPSVIEERQETDILVLKYKKQ